MPALRSHRLHALLAPLTLTMLVMALAACEPSGVIGTPPVDNQIDDPPAPPPPFEPADSALLRLTDEQYRNSIVDVFGEHVLVVGSLEPNNLVDRSFAVGSTYGAVSRRGIEQYEAMALNVAAQVMEPSDERDALMPCTPAGTTDDVCSRAFLSTFGRRLWRRSLTDTELDALVDVANQAATTLDDFYDGLEFGIVALLESPYFIYRIELGEDDGSGTLRFSSVEMASRLSYFLWNTTPDDELIDAAEAGELDDADALEARVRGMVADDRARQGARSFFTELFELNELDELIKDPEVFVHIDAEVGPSAREETLLLLEDNIFEQNGDYREVFISRTTFLDRKMASIYNVPTPAREGFAAYTFPDDAPRAGILTHASVLALHSHATATSATLRGNFIRTRIMCGTIPPPPADVDTSIPEPSVTATTLRERLREHRENPVCASCHSAMDPIGLGLENFDALGRYRRLEAGAVIDSSSDVDGEPFADAVGLGQLLHDHPDVPRCLTKLYYEYATAHVPTSSEQAQLNALSEAFAASGYRVQELMVQIALSDGFRTSSGMRLAAEN